MHSESKIEREWVKEDEFPSSKKKGIFIRNIFISFDIIRTISEENVWFEEIS